MPIAILSSSNLNIATSNRIVVEVLVSVNAEIATSKQQQQVNKNNRQASKSHQHFNISNNETLLTHLDYRADEIIFLVRAMCQRNATWQLVPRHATY